MIMFFPSKYCHSCDFFVKCRRLEFHSIGSTLYLRFGAGNYNDFKKIVLLASL